MGQEPFSTVSMSSSLPREAVSAPISDSVHRPAWVLTLAGKAKDLEKVRAVYYLSEACDSKVAFVNDYIGYFVTGNLILG